MKSVNIILDDYEVIVMYNYNKSIDYNYGANADNNLGMQREFINIDIIDVMNEKTKKSVDSSFAELDLIKDHIKEMEGSNV